ncbi:unnamed protein product [Caretta caretta]
MKDTEHTAPLEGMGDAYPGSMFTAIRPCENVSLPAGPCCTSHCFTAHAQPALPLPLLSEHFTACAGGWAPPPRSLFLRIQHRVSGGVQGASHRVYPASPAAGRLSPRAGTGCCTFVSI